MTTLNVTAELERLIADIVRHTEEFHHIDPARLMVCISTTRGGGVHGVYAKIHPLRFEGGARTTEIRRGRRRCTCEIPITEGTKYFTLSISSSPVFLTSRPGKN